MYDYAFGSQSHFMKHLWTVREMLKKDTSPAVHTFSSKAFNKHGLLTSASIGVYICSHHCQQHLEANSLCDDSFSVSLWRTTQYRCCHWLLKKWFDCGSQHVHRPFEVLSQRQQKVGILTMWAMVRTDLFLGKKEQKCSFHVCEKGL